MPDDPQADLEEILAFIERVLDQVSWYADRYKQHARQTKIKYLALRVPLIVLGVVVPQLVALQALF